MKTPTCHCFTNGKGADAARAVAMTTAEQFGEFVEQTNLCFEGATYARTLAFVILLRGFAAQQAESQSCDVEFEAILSSLLDDLRAVDAMEESRIAANGMTRQ